MDASDLYYTSTDYSYTATLHDGVNYLRPPSSKSKQQPRRSSSRSSSMHKSPISSWSSEAYELEERQVPDAVDNTQP